MSLKRDAGRSTVMKWTESDNNICRTLGRFTLRLSASLTSNSQFGLKKLFISMVITERDYKMLGRMFGYSLGIANMAKKTLQAIHCS